jgi:hypothetical protein
LIAETQRYACRRFIPDGSPDGYAEHVKRVGRESVASELASTLADGNRYVIRLVEEEEPDYQNWQMGTIYTVFAEITPVQTQHVTFTAPDYESMRTMELWKPATEVLVNRARHWVRRMCDKVTGRA